MSLALSAAFGHHESMTNGKPHPQVTEIASLAFAHSIPIRAALKQANIGRNAWWRWSKGGNANLTSLNRVREAVEHLIRERAK